MNLSKINITVATFLVSVCVLFSQDDKNIKLLEDFRDALAEKDTTFGINDRGQMYLHVYEITDSDAAILEGNIATFSGFVGGAAYLANYVLADQSENGNAGFVYRMDAGSPEVDIYQISQTVASDFMNETITVYKENGDGLSIFQGIASAKRSWNSESINMGAQFPGEILDHVPVATALLVPRIVGVKFPVGLITLWFNDGSKAAFAGTAGSLLFGKSLDDFYSGDEFDKKKLREKYALLSTPEFAVNPLANPFSIQNYVVKYNLDRNSDSTVDESDGIVAMLDSKAFGLELETNYYEAYKGISNVRINIFRDTLRQFYFTSGLAPIWIYALALAEFQPDWDTFRKWELMKEFRVQLVEGGEYDFVEYAKENGIGEERDFWKTANEKLGDERGIIKNIIYYYDREIIGGPDSDFIDGGLGDDVLYGSGGDDLIRGGMGVDRIRGGLGEDRIFGEDGNDVVTVDSPDQTVAEPSDPVGVLSRGFAEEISAKSADSSEGLAGDTYFGGFEDTRGSDDGTDTINFSLVGFGVEADLRHSQRDIGGTVQALDANGDTVGDLDAVYSFEEIIGTNQSDRFYLDGLSRYTLRGGEGLDMVTLYDESIVMETFQSYETEVLAIPTGGYVSRGYLHGEGLSVTPDGVTDTLTGSKFDGIGIFENVQYVKSTYLGNTYILPENVRASTQPTGVSLTLDYSGYGKSLSVDMLNGTVESGSETDRFVATDAGSKILAHIVGTKHGDMYDFGELDNSVPGGNGIYAGPLYSGRGDDTIKRNDIGDYSQSNKYMRFVFYSYSGGNDVFENISVENVDLPPGIVRSDLKFELLNKRVWFAGPTLKHYIYDLKVVIGSLGSLLSRAGVSHYEKYDTEGELFEIRSHNQNKINFRFYQDGKTVTASVKFKQENQGTTLPPAFEWVYTEEASSWTPATPEDDTMDFRTSVDGVNVDLGLGDDTLFATSFEDTIYGGLGQDTIFDFGGGGLIYGGGDDDTVYFSGDNMKVFGGSGEDTIEFEPGEWNTVYGNSDNDIIRIERIDESIGVARGDVFGGLGNDELDAWWGHLIDGEDGIDTAVVPGHFTDYSIFRGSDGLITLTQSNPFSTLTSMRLRNIEIVRFDDGEILAGGLKEIEPLSVDQFLAIVQSDPTVINADSVAFGDMLKEPLVEILESEEKFQELISARSTFRDENPGVENPVLDRIAIAFGNLRDDLTSIGAESISTNVRLADTDIIVNYENRSSDTLVVSPQRGTSDSIAGTEEFSSDGETVELAPDQSIEYQRALTEGQSQFYRASIKSSQLDRLEIYLGN